MQSKTFLNAHTALAPPPASPPLSPLSPLSPRPYFPPSFPLSLTRPLVLAPENTMLKKTPRKVAKALPEGVKKELHLTGGAEEFTLLNQGNCIEASVSIAIFVVDCGYMYWMCGPQQPFLVRSPATRCSAHCGGQRVGRRPRCCCIVVVLLLCCC